MKRLIVGVVCLLSLFPLQTFAQRGGGGGRTGGGGGFHGAGGGFRGSGSLGSGIQNGSIRHGFNGLPPVRPIPPLGSFRNFNQFGKRGNRGVGSGDFPFGYGGYLDAGYSDGGDQGQVIVLPGPESFVPPFFPPTPPPPPPQPVLHEYAWPGASNDPSATFTIVSNDGTSRSAVAVWVQNNTVRYFTADGTAGRLPLNSVNRAATRTANVAKNLRLSLPADGQGH